MIAKNKTRIGRKKSKEARDGNGEETMGTLGTLEGI